MSTLITWQLPGYADDLALSAAAGRLWAAASTATLASEQVWFGEVTADGIAGETLVLEAGACCRPALAAFDSGNVLALACAPDRLVAACGGTQLTRWQHGIDGVPVHVVTQAIGELAWIAVEVVRGRERYIVMMSVDPATGTVIEHHQLGGNATWCRWPALSVDAGVPIIAWCEGAPRKPGTIRIARWQGRPHVHDVSSSPGEAPALALLPDGGIAIAWHRGGAVEAPDHRDASVVRVIDLAIVRLDSSTVVAAMPPPGAGGSAPRGEDQGWEYAALATDPTGALTLVGRSSHGHHVARRRSDGTWTAAMPLDAGGWGGRGRRHALVGHRGELWLARRAPDGITIGACPEPPLGSARARPSRVLPARVVSRRQRSGVLFGDLHQHTAHSDGCGSVEELWIAARDERGLDFAAITDHDQFCRRAIGPATWQITSQIAASFDDPGRFAALAAYEFTGPRHPGPGHKCIYFGDRVPDRVPGRDLDALFALLRELDGIAVPHHVGWTGADFAHHDPVVQPVWEICSVHGCYEADGACPAHPPRADHVVPGHFVRDALDAGLRFGFIGATDSHGLDWHHGIARWRNPFRAGLACLVGAEPTRAGIIAALRARRSYATTGAKLVLRVELDGAPLGSELPPGTHGELLVEVTGTAPIAKITVVDGSGERVMASDCTGTFARARTRVAPRDGAAYVYVRVEQVDGEAAWASPFWI